MMKKSFEDPKMNISVFETENVITASGGDTPKTTNLDDAKSYVTNMAGITNGSIELIF